MAARNIIAEELQALNTIKDLAESYEEIAVIRMQKIRDSVLRTRDFLSDLSEIFVDLKASYEKEIQELLKKRKEGDKDIASILKKVDKTLMVYLSSNGKLYGSVTQKTYRLFIQDVKKSDQNKVDLLIVGEAGREMYDGSGVKRPYDYIEIPDTSVDIEHIKNFVKKFLQYKSVKVYYGKFGNVVTQNPIATSVTGDDVFETEVAKATRDEDKFIFEPVLEKIFHFFETQIMANLFSQTLLENQLSRHASRVNAMEEALVHIEEESKKLNRLKVRVKHLMQNKKQLETISGVAIWG